MKKSYLLIGLLVIAVTVMGGCSTVAYYGQSVVGHSRLMLARQDIDKAIEGADPELKRQLMLAKQLRSYAVTDLALPDNSSYLSYVDLQRKYPVWSVVAAKEFSLKPQYWCYPVVGCAAYRGYFAEANAEKYAQGLEAEGFQTHVGGATAYSTLGWFSDPLIPPMMRDGDMYLAQVMFHELAHQQFYLKGNSAFNEAFATVVGEHGTLKWLRDNNSPDVSKYETLMTVRNDFSAFIDSYKQRLGEVYKSTQSDQEKRQLKQAAQTAMQQSYETLVKDKWQGKRWYGNWMKVAPNNARLAAFSTYRELVPAFERLLESCEGDYSRFYKVVAKQKGLGKEALIAEECL